VDIAGWLGSLNMVDVAIVLFLFGMFILGFAQGAVRRLVGILTMTFSFFLAMQLHVPLGQFLAKSWTQYPPEYSYMIAFLTIFIAAVIAFALLVQGTYKKVEVLAKYPVIDEIIGGLLGILQGFLFLLFITMALDIAFIPLYRPDPDELPFLRDVWGALNTSGFGQMLHQTVIPALVATTGFLVPAQVRALYGAQ